MLAEPQQLRMKVRLAIRVWVAVLGKRICSEGASGRNPHLTWPQNSILQIDTGVLRHRSTPSIKPVAKTVATDAQNRQLDVLDEHCLRELGWCRKRQVFDKSRAR